MNNKKLGIIAGEGILPRTLSENALKQGYETYAIGLNLKSFLDLQGIYTQGKMIPGRLGGQCIEYFRSNKVEEIVFIGKIHKLWAISQIPFLDKLGRECLKRMINLEDNTFHKVLQEIAQENGFNIIPQLQFLKDLLPSTQIFTFRDLSEKEREDIDYGFDKAKKASELEVSQMVVVKNKSVMAFEAAEGTDKTIERGCKLAKKGGVVVKVKWKNQSDKFDLPTIGPRTIKTIAKHKGSILAIEANSTFVAEKEKTIALANKLGVGFLAI
ncbi:MAG: UDP-2,3-diacylglucosamine diphosphatase LpxI [Candidatus Caenarcaniphilales bacterium]|nr:UDP-2,3-diacylglucosamine diphosphatase LpxI [Candidatus Caenarcaniphilales bacterium]